MDRFQKFLRPSLERLHRLEIVDEAHPRIAETEPARCFSFEGG